MWKRVAVITALGAIVGAVGGAALAGPGAHLGLGRSSAAATSATSSGPATRTAAATPTARPRIGCRCAQRGPGARGRWQRLAHASWVARDPRTGQFVTHAAIHGDVAAVSSSAITVKAADGISQTYRVDAATKVRVRSAGQGRGPGSPASISQVRPGAHVLVLGTGTAHLVASRVVSGLRR